MQPLLKLSTSSLLAVVLWTTAPAAGGSGPAAPPVQAVESVGITVDDMDRSLAFYTGVLPFEKIADERHDGVDGLRGVRGPVRIVRLRLGEDILELRDYLREAGRTIPEDSRSHDHWFQHVAIIVRDMSRAYARLKAADVVHVSPAPQRLPDWNPNAGGIEAFYFLDPDRHVLEILAFPPDKGDRRWHRPGEDLFLGIDHTAIVVGDTDRSLAFYRDTLGLTVAGSSENYGPEQERLNNVSGAHLRITAVRAVEGPAVEFLHYLSPRDGRPAPDDTRPSDLVYWETTLRAGRLAALARVLGMNRVFFVSPGVVRGPMGQAASIVRDPDGHALRIVEKTS